METAPANCIPAVAEAVSLSSSGAGGGGKAIGAENRAGDTSGRGRKRIATGGTGSGQSTRGTGRNEGILKVAGREGEAAATPNPLRR